jgi:hypothetical protein
MIRAGRGGVTLTMDEICSYDKVRLSIGTFPAAGIGEQERRDGLYHPF